VAVDLVHTEQNRFVLFVCETLTGFCQAIPTQSTVTENELAKMLFAHWINLFGAPGRITSDNEIRWRSATGPWRAMLERFGIESHIATPYRSNANGRLERRIGEFVKQVSLLHSEGVCDADDAIPLAVSLLNSVPFVPHGFSAQELFLQRGSWTDALHTNEQWSNTITEHRNRLAAAREKRRAALRDFVTDVHIGSYVLIHSRRFPSQPQDRFAPKWLGPFLVVGKQGRVLLVQVNQREVKVDMHETKVYRGDDPLLPSPPPVMTDQEMAAEGVYRVEKIINHREVRGKWELETVWQNYSEATWNPPRNFISRFKTRPGKFMEETAAAYVAEKGPPALQAAAARLLLP
jgi:hypothetical protein